MTEQTTTAPEHNHVWPHTDPTPPKKKRWFTRPVVVLPIATLVLGLGLGMNNRPAPVTNTVEKPVEKIVTKEVTPTACITAIDLAQQGFTYSAESMRYMNDALQAAGKFNVAGLQQANADLEKLNPKISALTTPMKAAVTECRAGAK